MHVVRIDCRFDMLLYNVAVILDEEVRIATDYLRHLDGVDYGVLLLFKCFFIQIDHFLSLILISFKRLILFIKMASRFIVLPSRQEKFLGNTVSPRLSCRIHAIRQACGFALQSTSSVIPHSLTEPLNAGYNLTEEVVSSDTNTPCRHLGRTFVGKG
jgi:hypothetical protein